MTVIGAMIGRLGRFPHARTFGRLGLILVVLSFVGCQTMGPSEHGIRFRKLPPLLLGGVSSAVIPPGKTVMVVPGIDTIYTFNTALQDVVWGGSEGASHSQFVYTRALDGNEVALAMRVSFRISDDAAHLTRLVQEVAISNDEIRFIVSAMARAFIRSHMNALRTSQFLEKDALYAAVENVRKALADHLEPLGIIDIRVNLDRFQFERLLPDGSVDASYGDKLQEIQRLREDTEREQARIKTVEAQKQQELNEMQAKVNRIVQEATGFKEQAKLRGVSYEEAKKNEAEGILAQGKGEVQGLIEQMNALAAPGGMNMVRVEIARQLAKSKSKFVTLGSSQGLEVQRLDTNQLLGTLGLLEAAPVERPKEEMKGAPESSPDAGSRGGDR